PGGGVLLKGNASCPTNSLGSRTYNVAAIYLKDGLTYNSRDESNATVGSIGNQSGALVYVPSDASGNPIGPIPPKDPLVLRAAAGECITVNLFNKIKSTDINPTDSVFKTADSNIAGAIASPLPWNPVPQPDNNPSLVPVFPSVNVGMHAQLVGGDMSQNNGI